MTSAIQHTCRSCNNHYKGNFCNACGEKTYSEKDKKVSHLFNEAFHFSTHFDNKFFRALKLVFAKPGFLSREFCAGKRKKYYSPFSLFLVAVFLYLLFPLMQGFNMTFNNHLNNSAAFGMTFQQKWAEAKAAAYHASVDDIGIRFDKLSPKVSKVLLILIVPLIAAALALLFRKKKRYFFDHLMYAAEFSSFYIFFIFFLLPIMFMAVGLVYPIGKFGDSNPLFLSLQALGVWWIAAKGIQQFYGLKFAKAILYALLFLVLFVVVVLIIYRSFLFVVVMLFI